MMAANTAQGQQQLLLQATLAQQIQQQSSSKVRKISFAQTFSFKFDTSDIL